MERASEGFVTSNCFTDSLRSYPLAVKELLPSDVHDTRKYANKRAENSHRHIRRRERQIQGFKSVHQAQRFLRLYGRVNNLFGYGRHLISVKNHRLFLDRAFFIWSAATCG